MPTLTDYQASLNGVTIGDGTDYLWGVANIDGLGNPQAKTADVPLDQQDGAFGSPDYLDVRTLLLHLEIVQATDADAWDALETLKEAWLPATADVDLYVQLPGVGQVFYTGRPRSLEADCALARQGCITVIAQFDALDPTPQAVS